MLNDFKRVTSIANASQIAADLSQRPNEITYIISYEGYMDTMFWNYPVHEKYKRW